jgi:hypothetical protein
MRSCARSSGAYWPSEILQKPVQAAQTGSCPRAFGPMPETWPDSASSLSLRSLPSACAHCPPAPASPPVPLTVAPTTTPTARLPAPNAAAFMPGAVIPVAAGITGPVPGDDAPPDTPLTGPSGAIATQSGASILTTFRPRPEATPAQTPTSGPARTISKPSALPPSAWSTANVLDMARAHCSPTGNSSRQPSVIQRTWHSATTSNTRERTVTHR